MSEIKYQYAFIDEDRKKMISINEITSDNRKQYNFRCVGCGQELLPRAITSKCRKPHFYHKEAVNCSGETYLHKLTKHIIKNKFDTQPTFFIKYAITKECNTAECKYRNPRCREEYFTYQIDLKKYYDTCTEEATVNGYVADILLTDSKKPDREPVLIEVCVSHPCDDDKRNSGLRIIELRIREEQDAIQLQNMNSLQESTDIQQKEKGLKVEFISFKKVFKKPFQIKLQRYIYNPQLNPIKYLTEVACNNAHKKLCADSLLELNVINTKNDSRCGLWDVLTWTSRHKGTVIRFFYNPEGFYVEEVASSIVPMKKEYKVILAVSPYFHNYALFKEKILYYLSNKMNTFSLVVITDRSESTNQLTEMLSKDVDFIIERHEIDWNKYNILDAIKISYDEMTSYADALIAFWDGKSMNVKNMIEIAERKNIKVAVVRY